MVIRPAVPEDRVALYDICLRTADAGEDATSQYDDRTLPGEIWVGAYLDLVLELAFVAADADGPVGYVLGAADTAAFEAACEREWWPRLRHRFLDPAESGDVTPDHVLRRIIHHPPVTDPRILGDYPAHLHIDLLPRAHGRGAGRRLMETFLDALRRRRVPGVHLGVDARNRRAIGFYSHLGFVRLAPPQPADDDGLLFGRALE
jgi:ribosomal protein S18 acetylase RimI-like enzyme